MADLQHHCRASPEESWPGPFLVCVMSLDSVVWCLLLTVAGTICLLGQFSAWNIDDISACSVLFSDKRLLLGHFLRVYSVYICFCFGIVKVHSRTAYQTRAGQEIVLFEQNVLEYIGTKCSVVI